MRCETEERRCAPQIHDQGVTAIHVADNADVRRLEMDESARFVRIQLNGTAALQLAEVKIGVTGWENIAVGKSATQSSTNHGGVASRAVDGNRDGNFSNGSVTFTYRDVQTWWEVDLGSVEMIEMIRLWNRSDSWTHRLANFHILVSDVPFVSTVIADVQSQPGVLDIFHAGGNGRDRKFGIGRTGRYVRVQLEAQEYLHFAEMEIYVNTNGGQALLLGDEDVLVTALAPRLDIEAVADDQLIVDAKGGMTPTLRPSFFRGPLETLPGAMRVVVSWANRQTSEHALAIDAISEDLAPDALAESTQRTQRRATSGERPTISSPEPRDSRPAYLTASAASVTGARRYSLYSPEMNLLSETEYTDAATPPIQHDYVWFAGAPVAQVTHSVPSEPLAAVGVVWTVTDHLGTPRIQTDSTGAIVWHAEHEPYGRIYLLREGEGRHQPLRFPGQEAEQLGVNAANGVTDRNYNIFRWYRAGEGRYTQADPLGLFPDMSEGAEENVFGYASANPLANSDTLGLSVMTKNCGSLDAKIQAAAGDADAAAQTCLPCNLRGPFKKAIRSHGTKDEIVIECVQWTVSPESGVTACGQAKYFENKIQLTPAAFDEGAYGCLKSTILHEFLHMILAYNDNEKLIREQEKKCFSCA